MLARFHEDNVWTIVFLDCRSRGELITLAGPGNFKIGRILTKSYRLYFQVFFVSIIFNTRQITFYMYKLEIGDELWNDNNVVQIMFQTNEVKDFVFQVASNKLLSSCWIL